MEKYDLEGHYFLNGKICQLEGKASVGTIPPKCYDRSLECKLTNKGAVCEMRGILSFNREVELLLLMFDHKTQTANSIYTLKGQGNSLKDFSGTYTGNWCYLLNPHVKLKNYTESNLCVGSDEVKLMGTTQLILMKK